MMIKKLGIQLGREAVRQEIEVGRHLHRHLRLFEGTVIVDDRRLLEGALIGEKVEKAWYREPLSKIAGGEKLISALDQLYLTGLLASLKLR